MIKVKIYGAGSIGNHLAQASRRAGWSVAVVDSDPEALRRMKEEIYPKRYGAWDEQIEQYKLGEEPKGGFDAIFLGTPPHVRMSLARKALEESPKVILLEKPLCPPSLEDTKEFQNELKKTSTAVLVGYDHAVSKSVRKAEEIIKTRDFGRPQALDVEFRETWKGIFNAHPWLSGPSDTYLGFWEKGGGASGEHSHALNLWQHFARLLGFGEVKEVSAVMQMVKTNEVEYDQASFFNLTTDKDFIGRVAQDVVTEPVKKSVRIQFEKGFLELLVNGFPGGDLIRFGEAGKDSEEIQIEKKRPDDFYEEILHISEILEGKTDWKQSPISFMRGLATMRVVAAAHKSRKSKKSVVI